jgi:hypothetical protein
MSETQDDPEYRALLAKLAQPVAEKVHALIVEEFMRLLAEAASGDDAFDADDAINAVGIGLAHVLGATTHAARLSMDAIVAQVRQGYADQAKRQPYETEAS